MLPYNRAVPYPQPDAKTGHEHASWEVTRNGLLRSILGEDIKGYGYAGMNPMACGLVAMELHRGDGGLGVVLSVHADLVMPSVAMCGSEEQRTRWLPAMARMDELGAFGPGGRGVPERPGAPAGRTG